MVKQPFISLFTLEQQFASSKNLKIKLDLQKFIEKLYAIVFGQTCSECHGKYCSWIKKTLFDMRLFYFIFILGDVNSPFMCAQGTLKNLHI